MTNRESLYYVNMVNHSKPQIWRHSNTHVLERERTMAYTMYMYVKEQHKLTSINQNTYMYTVHIHYVQR